MGGERVTLEWGESVRTLDAGRKLRLGENHQMNIFRGDIAIGLRASQAKRELRMHSEEAHLLPSPLGGNLGSIPLA